MTDCEGNIPSQSSWPALLGLELNLQYECLAWPGRGNFFIANQILDQLASNESALYIVNWTWIDRFDFIDLNNKEQWETLRPGLSVNQPHPHGDFYYRNLHSELRDKLDSLQLIKLVTAELLASGQPFIMTYMDELIFDQRWHTTPSMLKQQEFLRPLMLFWNLDTMPDAINWSQWAQLQGHPIGANRHLLESGHKLVFQNVLNRLQHDQIATASQLSMHKI